MSIVLFSTACDFVPTAGHGTPKEDFPLFTMIATSVVGGENAGYVHRIAEDKYGRILFDFGIENLLSWYYGGIEGYGICQKIENGYAYYYEDVSYIGAESLEIIDSEDIEELKKINDWDKALDNSKTLTKVKSIEKRYEDNVFDISESEESNALELFGNTHGISNNELKNYEIRSSCRDINGKTLFYIAVAIDFGEDGRPESSELYAVIVDVDNDLSETAILKIDNPYDCAEQLRTFKLQNEWVPRT